MDTLKIIADSAQVHVTWALSILGGTIAAIIGTSYLSPQKKKLRMWYLLFIPGWILLALSIYYCDKISRRNIAAGFVPEEKLLDIVRAMTSDYQFQQLFFFAAIIVFVLWLLVYLIWWVFMQPNGK